jgi:hypothetical protein
LTSIETLKTAKTFCRDQKIEKPLKKPYSVAENGASRCLKSFLFLFQELGEKLFGRHIIVSR